MDFEIENEIHTDALVTSNTHHVVYNIWTFIQYYNVLLLTCATIFFVHIH